jgi:hypothetical protein
MHGEEFLIVKWDGHETKIEAMLHSCICPHDRWQKDKPLAFIVGDSWGNFPQHL